MENRVGVNHGRSCVGHGCSHNQRAASLLSDGSGSGKDIGQYDIPPQVKDEVSAVGNRNGWEEGVRVIRSQLEGAV